MFSQLETGREVNALLCASQEVYLVNVRGYGGYKGKSYRGKGFVIWTGQGVRGQVYQGRTGQKKRQKNPECREQIAMGGGKKNIGFCRGSVCVWCSGTSNPYVSNKFCIFTKTLRYGLRKTNKRLHH